MKRRSFLSTSAAASAHALTAWPRAFGAPASPAGTIHTVRGPIDVGQMGVTLVHEHVLVDFAGAEKVSRSRYDADEAFRTILPYLQDLQKRGCRTLLECTPAYLGRDPLLLRRLSEASGMHIVTNTGYYGAGSDSAVPKHAYAETATQLAARWTAEYRSGIEGTGVRARIREGRSRPGAALGDRPQARRGGGALPPRHRADPGRPHRRGTGRPGDHLHLEAAGRLARGVRLGALPERKDPATRSWAARQGTWVELDGVGPTSLETHVEAVVDLFRRDQLDRVLVSQDSGWYHVGEPGGGSYRPHTFLFDAFVPTLVARGLREADVRTLLVENPARAFAVRRRTQPAAD